MELARLGKRAHAHERDLRELPALNEIQGKPPKTYAFGVFNTALMNDALYKFKRYEDASLVYVGVDKDEGEDAGLYDTVLSPTEYAAEVSTVAGRRK